MLLSYLEWGYHKMNLTSRTTTSNGEIIAWVDNDGKSWIEQDFNPKNQSAWSSETDALAWADAWISQHQEEFND